MCHKIVRKVPEVLELFYGDPEDMPLGSVCFPKEGTKINNLPPTGFDFRVIMHLDGSMDVFPPQLFYSKYHGNLENGVVTFTRNDPDVNKTFRAWKVTKEYEGQFAWKKVKSVPGDWFVYTMDLEEYLHLTDHQFACMFDIVGDDS